ncbi:MAG: GNAT family N-acetyltransferase [Gammaproteobacteria bacterium]|nr:GNAT family N-acetyltransferase [Gammaproteobacteria bacterium]
MNGLDIVILAAGQGKRMQKAGEPSLPKVLYELSGIPLLHHVIRTAQKLHPANLLVVVGFEQQQVRSSLEEFEPIQFVEQPVPRGTGDAVRASLAKLDPANHCLVLYGDVPLIDLSWCRQLVQQSQQENSLVFLTAEVYESYGYGRVVEDRLGNIQTIVEEKDASPEEKTINHINTGILCAPKGCLQQLIPLLTPHNQQNEYYLTDIASLARERAWPVRSLRMPKENVTWRGVNTRDDLEILTQKWADLFEISAVQPEQAEEFWQASQSLIPQLSSRPPPSLGYIKTLLGNSNVTLIVARYQGEIVGMLNLIQHANLTALRTHINDVVVDQTMRGFGISKKLVSKALELSKEWGAVDVDLTSRPDREIAHKLYQGMGFVARNTRVYRYSF